ncbi:MAG: tRNA (uracil-5-)-methyltransferase [Venatoribacter sp.]
MNDNIVNFQQASEKQRAAKIHAEKDKKVEAIRARFEKALPTQDSKLKTYFKNKKKR